jgi:CheY-like chemotaxis protein
MVAEFAGAAALGFWCGSISAALFAGVVLFFLAGIYKALRQIVATLGSGRSGGSERNFEISARAIEHLRPWIEDETSLTEESAKACCAVLLDTLATLHPQSIRWRIGRIENCLTPLLSRRRLCPNHPNGAYSFQECCMYRPPPLRGRLPFDGKKVLLIDEKQTTSDTRANVLRGHGVEVDVADSLQRAHLLWRPRRYDLVLLDVRRQLPGEALQFYEQIRDASPSQRFAFLVGPPVYLSRNWPLEITIEATAGGQWGQTVTRFARAA